MGELELPLVGWLALAGLGYCLVTAVLYVLSSWLAYQRQRHDLTVECRRRQLQQHAAKQEQERAQTVR